MKKILLSTMFILLIMNVIHSQTQNDTISENKKITLEDIWKSNKFYPQTINSFRSMQNDDFYTILNNNGNIEKYSYSTGKLVETIVNIELLNQQEKTKALQYTDYVFSNDETKILLISDVEPIYRHSFTANYWIYDVKTKVAEPLSENGKQELATFSPDGKKIAFVRDNNIYIKDISTKQEKEITNDGLKNSIINGSPDWVYQEEFSFTKAFEWSKDGSYIAYLKFDESKVKEYQLEIYGDLYPETYKYKYPKAGENNSVVSVNIYNTKTEITKAVDLGSDTDIYIPRIKWTNNDNVLSIQKLNRLQNDLTIFLTDASSGKTNVLYNEKDKYYIEITDNLIFSKDNSYFIFTSGKDGYNHIYQYDMNGKEMQQLTKGKFEVTELLGLDNKSKKVFYSAAFSSPINREIFSVSIKNGVSNKISKLEGTNSAEFSANYKYYINTYTTANKPHYITMNTSSGKELYVLQNNQSLIDLMKDYQFSKVEFMTINTEDSVQLNASIIKPYDFDPNKKYPVLMYVYGGPGSQTVINSWGWSNFLWFEMLAQKGYIVVSVDNRGTGARGEDFKKITYEQLGKYETQDQISAAKYLASLNYVDGNRIGVFGWSFGGYLSSLCITKGADYFKAAIAVAPVTNWRYYDNIYTERYMRTPQENASGYDNNSPISHASELKGKFLLVHGVADDNVHIQNSMDFVTALVNKNKQFEMQFYPNNDHGIRTGKNTRFHLYTRMTNFILDNL